MRFPAAGILSRRRFALGMMTALIGGLASALPGFSRVAPGADLGMLVGRRESAERVGRRYLSMLPADIDRSRLLKTSPALDRALRATRRKPEAAARLLRQSIEDDFRRANTVVVDGWVLALTEARLCAIIALS
jgi:hypothetical protein